MDIAERLAAQIKTVRRERGISITAMARRLGWAHTNVCRLERGQHDIRLSTLLAVARGLDTTAAEILSVVEVSE